MSIKIGDKNKLKNNSFISGDRNTINKNSKESDAFFSKKTLITILIGVIVGITVFAITKLM